MSTSTNEISTFGSAGIGWLQFEGEDFYMEREHLEWKDIKGYEDQYQVSNYGDFHIKEYDFIDKANRHLHRDEKYIWTEELSPYGGDTMQGQYLGIHLGGMKKSYAHRVAAIAFLDNPDNKPEINHIDGNTHNNYCGCKENDYKDSNLEWVTRKENMEHASKNGLINHESRLRKTTCLKNREKSLEVIRKPVVQLTLDGKYIDTFESVVDASKKTGIAKTTIGYVCNREGYHRSAGGFLWVFENEYNPDKEYNLKKILLPRGKKIIQMDLDGNFIAEYDNCMDAERKNKDKKFDNGYIRDCCNGKRKTHKGFTWKYKE
jgi:hypothetical protein